MEKFCWVKFEPSVSNKEDMVIQMADLLNEEFGDYHYQAMRRLPDGEIYLYRTEE